MKFGLILVDIQNDYFEGGQNELVNPKQAAAQAKKVLAFFRLNGWPLFHVCHISQNPNAGFFKPDTIGADFYYNTSPLAGENIIIKHKPDSFLNTNLNEMLISEGVEALVVCGMMTHMCIDTTVRSAVSHGYPVTLIEDACATKDLVWRGATVSADQVQNAYMAAMSGTFAKVRKADDWIMENRV